MEKTALLEINASHALVPLVLFALWPLVFAIWLILARSGAVMAGKRAVTSFKTIGDADPFFDRLSRVHLNALESLPIFAVVLLACLWVKAEGPIAMLAWTAFGARILQSLIHAASGSALAIQGRVIMFFVQVVCFVWLGALALQTALLS